VLLTSINVIGVKQSVNALLVVTVIKLAPLFLFALVGIAGASGANLFTGAPPPFETLGSSILMLLYAFVGFEGSLVPAGEGKDPRRDIPRALLWGLLVTTTIYIFVHLACLATLPSLPQSERPIADAATVLAGQLGGAVIAISAAVSIFGTSAGAMLSAPRMTYALAVEGTLPRFLGAVHERFRTPHVSVVLFGLLYFVLATQGDFKSLASMSSLARIIVYASCIAALPLIERRLGKDEGLFKIPGGWTIPILSFLVCVWLISSATAQALIFMLVFLLAGALLYAIARAWK
jgi:amino acid transporter